MRRKNIYEKRWKEGEEDKEEQEEEEEEEEEEEKKKKRKKEKKRKEKKGKKKLTPLVGLEPTTFELEVQHANPLRHRGCWVYTMNITIFNWDCRIFVELI